MLKFTCIAQKPCGLLDFWMWKMWHIFQSWVRNGGLAVKQISEKYEKYFFREFWNFGLAVGRTGMGCTAHFSPEKREAELSCGNKKYLGGNLETWIIAVFNYFQIQVEDSNIGRKNIKVKMFLFLHLIQELSFTTYIFRREFASTDENILRLVCRYWPLFQNMSCSGMGAASCGEPIFSNLENWFPFAS